MDPNATLQEIRELVGNNGGNDVGRLVELIDALDEWLTNGGFLPSDWKAS